MLERAQFISKAWTELGLEVAPLDRRGRVGNSPESRRNGDRDHEPGKRADRNGDECGEQDFAPEDADGGGEL